MEPAALTTLALIFSVLACLALTRVAPDVILMAALAFLVISGILTPSEALAGFANPGVMTIATLYVVAAGLKETGAIQWLAHRLLGQPRRLRQAQLPRGAGKGVKVRPRASRASTAPMKCPKSRKLP